MGWTRARRCIFLRRPAERTPSRPALPASTEFDFVQVLDHGPNYEYILSRIGEFFNRIKVIAEQLSPEAVWAIILSVAFRVWLRGKGLHPVVEGNQTLLLLTT